MKRLLVFFSLLFATPAWAVDSTWSTADATLNGFVLSNGNLSVSNNAVVGATIRGSTSKTSGKWYFEFYAVASAGNERQGVADVTTIVTGALGYNGHSAAVGYAANTVTAGFTSNYAVSNEFTYAGGTIQFAIDFDSGKIWAGLDNTWAGGSNPATGSLPIISFVPATVGALFPALQLTQPSETWTLKATADSQKYVPPTGFRSWDVPAISIAQVGITPLTVPVVVQVLDNTNTWVRIGTINASTHIFTPATQGVNCAAGVVSLTTLVVTAGVVTHC